METKNNSTSITDSQRIGRAMKQIRLSHNLKPLHVASHFGYIDDSTYYRLERGETVYIDEAKIRAFCKLFDCNMVYLYVLAGIDIFETEIKTWTQFYKTIPKLNDVDERNLLSEIQHIGNAMRRIRQSKDITTDYIARKFGYEDISTYCKMECGNLKHIDESIIRAFCKLMDCNIVHLYKLAGIDVFETKIKTWDEFYSLIPRLNDEEAKHIIELAKKISPPPYKINSYGQAA